MADLTKAQKRAVGIGAAAVGAIGILALAFRKRKRPQPAFYLPGDTIESVQGASFVLRLPRGDYRIITDDLAMIASLDVGINTDVVLSVPSAPSSYTAQPILIDEDRPDEQHTVTVIARRAE
jgi:hypothetical protein